MSINKTFGALYDKIYSPSFASRNATKNFFEVNEYECNATVKILRVEHSGAEYDSYNHMIVKGMKDITEERSSNLQDSDCDGIAFEIGANHEGLILAELKSRFSTQRLGKALKQMTYSFLKMHSMLSICKEYDIDKLSIRFVAACQCFENEDQKMTVYNMLSKAESIGNQSFEGAFLRKLIENHNISVKFGDIARLWNLSLNKKLMDKDIVLSLQLTQHYGDSSLVYTY